MHAVTVRSYKYDGSPRDEYRALCDAASDEQIVVVVPPGTRAFDHRTQHWEAAPDGVIQVYSRCDWYHVWHICEQHSGRAQTYVHVATPARYVDDTLTWTDLDLDVRVNVDGSVEVLDDDEFEQNARRMRYPPGVVARCREACAQVLAGLAAGAGAFDRSGYVELYAQLMARPR